MSEILFISGLEPVKNWKMAVIRIYLICVLTLDFYLICTVSMFEAD